LPGWTRTALALPGGSRASMGHRLPPRPMTDLQSCGGCDAQLARATLAITGWVQKVSNLILNRKVWDAGTGGLLAGASLAGASVAGASVAGASVAGASVAGASVDLHRNTQVSRSRALADPVADRPLPPGAS
jgi:hypothetical protein